MIGLGISLTLGGQNGAVPSKGPLCDAIARTVFVTAKYDDEILKLAPHIVYSRGHKNVPTLDAVLMERAGHVVNRPNLRTYAVSELVEITITNDSFSVSPDFEADEIQYAGRTVCVVDLI